MTAMHGRMAKGGHGLPKVSPGSALPYPSMPREWATPETAYRPFQGSPARRVGGLRPSSFPLDAPRRTPMQQRGSMQERKKDRLKTKGKKDRKDD
jgi:hypothetical protein